MTEGRPLQIIATNDRIEIIKRSLRCFRYGLIGLLPGIGIPFAVLALEDWLFVRQQKAENWNPAARYVHIGALAGTVGLLLTLLVGAIVTIGEISR